MLANVKDGLIRLGLWLLVAALAGLIAYQIYTAMLLGGVALTTSRFRPLYWNFTRVKWLGRFMGFVLGAGWLFSVSLAESMMREWHKYNELVPRSFRLVGWMVATWFVFYIISQVVVYMP